MKTRSAPLTAPEAKKASAARACGDDRADFLAAGPPALSGEKVNHGRAAMMGDAPSHS